MAKGFFFVTEKNIFESKHKQGIDSVGRTAVDDVKAVYIKKTQY